MYIFSVMLYYISITKYLSLSRFIYLSILACQFYNECVQRYISLYTALNIKIFECFLLYMLVLNCIFNYLYLYYCSYVIFSIHCLWKIVILANVIIKYELNRYLLCISFYGVVNCCTANFYHG